MRVFTAFAAFSACFAAGLYKSFLLKRRAVVLEELCRMVKSFSVEIRYTAPTLDELCGKSEGVFAEILNECRKDSDIHAAWDSACAILSKKPYCSREEAELLRNLGSSLGASDIAGQLSILEMYSEKLSDISRTASEEAAGKGKLFRSVGMLCGIGAAVIAV